MLLPPSPGYLAAGMLFQICLTAQFLTIAETGSLSFLSTLLAFNSLQQVLVRNPHEPH